MTSKRWPYSSPVAPDDGYESVPTDLRLGSKDGMVRLEVEAAVLHLKAPFTIPDIVAVTEERYSSVAAVVAQMRVGGYLARAPALVKRPGERGPLPDGYELAADVSTDVARAIEGFLRTKPAGRFSLRDVRDAIGLPPSKDRAIRYALMLHQQRGIVYPVLEVDFPWSRPAGRPPRLWTNVAADIDEQRSDAVAIDRGPLPPWMRSVIMRCQARPARSVRTFHPGEQLPVGDGRDGRIHTRPGHDTEQRRAPHVESPATAFRRIAGPVLLALHADGHAWSVAELAAHTGSKPREVRRNLATAIKVGYAVVVGTVDGAPGPNPARMYQATKRDTTFRQLVREALRAMPAFFTLRELRRQLGKDGRDHVAVRLSLEHLRLQGWVEVYHPLEQLVRCPSRRGVTEWWTATPAIVVAVRQGRARRRG